MSFIYNFQELLFDFMHTGGDILWALLFLTFFMWVFLIERFIYLYKLYPVEMKNLIAEWNQRKFKDSWVQHKIRDGVLNKMAHKLLSNISSIKILVALAPMLGLLGTVFGMINIFDVMADMGTSNARMMASGISKATISTMVGMVIAILGMYLGSLVEQKARREFELLVDHIELHEDQLR